MRMPNKSKIPGFVYFTLPSTINTNPMGLVSTNILKRSLVWSKSSSVRFRSVMSYTIRTVWLVVVSDERVASK